MIIDGPDLVAGALGPFFRRLSAARLTAADIGAIASLVGSFRDIHAQADLVREGDTPNKVHVLVAGIACRYKLVEGGRRQIVSFLVPGDVCDIIGGLRGTMDHSVLCLSDAKVAVIAKDALRDLLDDHPKVMLALLRLSLLEESISREWLANMGRRSPDKRIAHLLCEMLARLETVGLADENRFAFPITQADLGDTVGLSTVHVNRTLQDLKEQKLIATKRGLFEVVDLARLRRFCDFDSGYLAL